MSCTLGNSYIVKAGDALFIIAQKKLGDENRWREIEKPDGTPYTDADASNLQVGQEICIPNVVAPTAEGFTTMPHNEIQAEIAAHNGTVTDARNNRTYPGLATEFPLKVNGHSLNLQMSCGFLSMNKQLVKQLLRVFDNTCARQITLFNHFRERIN